MQDSRKIVLLMVLLLAVGVCLNKTNAQENGVAETPPMGWNSWDAYAESVKESDIRANAEWMAKNLK